MKQELDEKLCKDFPLLYATRHGKPTETLMCFGFDMDVGWYGILYEVSAKLEEIIRKQENPEEFYAVQVKEKFGTARLYLSYETEEMSEVIREFERKSAITCEYCGVEGKLRPDLGWVKTLCKTCYNDALERIEESRRKYNEGK